MRQENKDNESSGTPLINTEYEQQAGLGIFFSLIPFPNRKTWFEHKGAVSARKHILQKFKDLRSEPLSPHQSEHITVFMYSQLLYSDEK